MEPTSFCSLELSQGALHILIFGSQVGFGSLKICRRLEPNAAEYGFEAVLDFEASACAKLARNASISVFSEDSRFTQSDEPLVWVTAIENKHTGFRSLQWCELCYESFVLGFHRVCSFL